MTESELLRTICDELKRTILVMVNQVRRDHPTDRLYAVLLAVLVALVALSIRHRQYHV